MTTETDSGAAEVWSRATPGRSAVQLCDYVERPFESVIAALEASTAQALVERVLEEVTGFPAEVRRAGGTAASRHVASFPVSWRNGAFEGQATLTAIVVHGGRHPLTEVLVRVHEPDAPAGGGDRGDATTALLRRFLDVLTRELARSVDHADQAGGQRRAAGRSGPGPHQSGPAWADDRVAAASRMHSVGGLLDGPIDLATKAPQMTRM